MTPPRWAEVERLYHLAHTRSPEERGPFLDEACAGDPALRREVESLLAQMAPTEGFLDSSALAGAAQLVSQIGEPMRPGRHVGVYEIQSFLGAGGMGEVYRARDMRLGRDVAIKLLPRAFTSDPERLERFEREARLLAALNHPHIGAIFGSEDADGVPALILELVDGSTLAERLASGPMPVSEALILARQMADGLDAAHAKGIIHRDLKPANVKITAQGFVKVLDFGLATAFTTGEAQSGSSAVPTVMMTAPERVQPIGTPAYMSPEQARGHPVDARTDVWAFGCVLYEMLTGAPVWARGTVSGTIAAILEREPAWSLLPRNTPERVRDLLKRCLQKDPSRRLRAIADARLALDEVLAPRTRSRVGHAAAAVSIISGLIVVATVLWTQSRHRLPERSEWTQVTKLPDSVMQPALSPDGRMLAFLRGPNTFIGPAEVYVKMLPDGEPVQLTHDGTSKMSPAFSPDGSRIAYSVIGQHGEAWDTWTVPVLGGTPELWLPNASALTWVDAQHVLFSEIKMRVHLAITTSLESRADSRDVYLPAHDHGMAHRSFVSPDHQSVLVVEMDETDSWMPCRLVPFDGSTHGRQVGPPGPCTSAAWSPDGKWMYFSAAKPGDNYHLWRQRFPDGPPEQISSGPTEEEGIVVSSDGRTLVTAVGMRQRPISLHDDTGDHQISLEGYAFVPRLYAAGKKVYYRISRTGAMFKQGVEIWMGDLASGHNEPVLPGFSVQQTHDISEDGRLLVAATGPDKKSHLWLARLDRRTPPRQIPGVESDWALLDPSGGVLFLANVGTGRFLFHIRDDGTGKKQVSTQPIQEIWGVSPDGAWVSGEGPGQDTSSFDYAYSTRGFPPVAVCNPPCRLRWAHDGQFLYFSIPKGYMFYGGVGLTYVLPVRTGTAFPDLPATGFRSEAELAAAPGVRIIEAADVDPGPSPTVYVFSRQVVQRNLYRIPLQ